MKKTRKTTSNVNNTVNLISGAYTLPLLDKLFSNGQKLEDMNDIYFALTALFDTNRVNEAFHMIRGLFGIAELEYPLVVLCQEKVQVKRELFTLIFCFMLHQFPNALILSNISFHIH